MLDIVASKCDETTTHAGKWTKEEDTKLKDAVEKRNGKDWSDNSKLVPGRTKQQCLSRWHDNVSSKSDETTARVGKWTTDEDVKLKDAVEKYNTDWTAISKLVPDRTIQQCRYRWAYRSNPSRITTTEEEG
jgi:hypothetical protein